MIIGFICSILIIVFDQFTKFLVYGSPAGSVIGDLLWFESTLNTGVAFSMFEGESAIFIITSILASLVFVYLIISKRFLNSNFEKLTVGLILGGTISNVIDRIIFNGVRDFIYLKFINFAIFNVADMAITIGAILLCVSVIFFRKNDDNKKEEK